ncbi:hypothetical protein BH23CHL8_BH23CHL8_28660 [soil metagenome]
MDDVRVGRLLRALRKRRHLTQAQIGVLAGVSQSLVSLIERGHLATVSMRVVRDVFAVVDARFEGLVTWRGGAVDRLTDERHAVLVGAFARLLISQGWEVHVEVTFNEFGDRGSIDIVGLRRELGIALIVEIKTELTAIDDAIRRIDVKERLAVKIVHERFGFRPGKVARLLAIQDSATNRRRVTAHDGTLLRAFPVRGRAVREWLRVPSGPLSGLGFFSSTNGRGTRRPERASRGAIRPDPPSATTPAGK